MKRVLLGFTLILISALSFAQGIQKMRVVSFKYLPYDRTASSLEGKRIDQNGQVAALIKIVTTETGFTFEGGSLGIVDSKQEKGEVWVWVPRASRKITLKHAQLGVLRDYMFPVEINSECVYEMVLETVPVPGLVPGPVITQQFLMFKVTPKEAIVTVDGTPWQVVDGVANGRVELGQHEYRIEAKDYHSDAGKVMVKDLEKTVVKEIELIPAFGYLKIEGDSKLLSQSSIYIDNGNGSEALNGAMKLASGQHKVSVIHGKYKPFERMVTITDGVTNVLSVDMEVNFSTVTLKVDAGAEIYVNNELKGVRSWTGDLVAGKYLIECRMKNHESTRVEKIITEYMGGQTITLQAPIPINGALVVNSNPPLAKIIVDGKDMGVTPKQFNAILIGEHTIRLEKQGCAPLQKVIVIEKGKALELNETLDTGRSKLVKTDRKGDKIYVDGDYVGTTPYETPLGFGTHTIRVVRNGVKVEKEVVITENTVNGGEMVFEFGRLITISTDQEGDVVMVDGEKVGNSPVKIDLPHGDHLIHAERGEKKYADKHIVVKETGGETSHLLYLHGETASRFVEKGVNFVTLDAAYNFNSLLSYGITVGSVKKFGWFVTALSNFSFDAMNYNRVTDDYGLVDGYYPNYNGITRTTRFSFMGGMVVNAGGPLCFRVGAGYGARCVSNETYSGDVVKVSSDSFAGVDATAGLQLNLKGFTISLDAITTNFQTAEFKLGLGYCWKRK